ncbi:MAG: DUF2058 domain-containing protein [Cellvibrionaceae bacterium]
MSKSLQDQLLGAGLVDTKKAKKISKETRKEKKVAKKNKDTGMNEMQSATFKAQQDKAERDRELNRLRNEEAGKKALAAQIAQLVGHYKVSRAGADIDYNFTDGKTVKKMLVTQRISEELVKGRLCIVRLTSTYEVIPKPIAEKIQERDASAIVVSNTSAANSDTSTQDDDDSYYAQFEIPDDLIW